MDTLYLNNDHIIELNELRDSDGSFVVDANVQATLFENGTNTPVSGVAWPVTLTYQGKAGSYSADLSRAAAVQEGGRYQLKLSAESVGKQYEVVRNVKVSRRYS